MASTDLIRRWQALDDRALWLLLAALRAGYLLVLPLLTQSPDEAVNMLLLMGEGSGAGGRPTSTGWGE